jgi:hypothetical protein|tara:strand:- start:42 stop:809 length:768 start_codon:yes stop_codon:yes gene_type:complete
MKKIYVLDLWGRGGEIAFHELTKAGYAMTYNNAWSHENWWEFDDIELDRMKEAGFKNEAGYWHDGQSEYRLGVHQNIDSCWFDVWETTEEHMNELPDEDKDGWTKITKDHENGMDAKHDLQCVWSQEEFFHTDCDIREFEEEHEDSERPMTPLLGLYSDEKGSWGYWSIELEEEIDPKRIVYAIAETQFGDMVTNWAYISKDNKIVHFEELEGPEGDTKGMYSTLGWKLDEDKWDKEVPWNEVAVAVKEGEFEFE